MGNQPSTPSVPPPVITVCDANCQREKLLSGLKTTLDSKEETKTEDPEGYEQARIAYYTALNGDEWLISEKDKIAKNEVSPKITEYTNKYNDLKKHNSSQQVFVNLMNTLKADEANDQENLHYMKKQLQSEKDKADVLNRLTVLGESSEPTTNYMPIILDVVLSILGIVVLYLAYKKFDIIKGYFGYTSYPMNVGGKRLPH